MKKKLLALLALLLLFGGTTVAFAYWDDLAQTEQEVLVIGEGVTLEVAAVATAPANSVLVPDGVVMKANDVDSIVLTYNVALDKAALAALDLSVTYENVKINNVADTNNLVNINITTASAVVNDADVLVTVTVTLNEPNDFNTYQDIIGESISFDLVFEASQA